MKTNYFSSVAAFILLLWLTACGNNQTSIPSFPVSMQVDLVQYNDLAAYGAMRTFITPPSGLDALGFGGVLVVHTLNMDADTYCAFDLACPYEAQRTVRVEPQDDKTVKCPQCGSVFRVIDGTGFPSSGVSKNKLRQYAVTYDANLKKLYVRN